MAFENLAALEELAIEADNVMFLEPRSTYDCAIIGLTHRAGNGLTVVAYDRDKCIEALMRENEWDDETAEEWFSFNTSSAWVGVGTPVFVETVALA